jgi:hypothetical protein
MSSFQNKRKTKPTHLRYNLLITLNRADLKRACCHSRSGARKIENAIRLSSPSCGQGRSGGRIVGLLNKNASTYTAKDRIKQAFSEWQESEIQVSFHKAWASVCKLILQLDQAPLSW